MTGASFVVMFASFSFCCAVQVFSRGADGKPAWRTAPSWRDRSVVPRPAPKLMAVNNKRVMQVPRPRTIEHVHVSFPVSEKEVVENAKNSKDKKTKIRRVFFSLPIGGQLPVFYSSKSDAHQKKNMIGRDDLGARHPFLENAPERSIDWNILQGNTGYLKDVALASRAIARQEPETEDAVSRGLGTTARTGILGNDAESYDSAISRKPLQTIYRRSRPMETIRKTREVHSTNFKPVSATNTSNAVVLPAKREPQDVVLKATNNTKKSGLPEATNNTKKSGLPEGNKRGTTSSARNKIDKEMEFIITKFMVVL